MEDAHIIRNFTPQVGRLLLDMKSFLNANKGQPVKTEAPASGTGTHYPRRSAEHKAQKQRYFVSELYNQEEIDLRRTFLQPEAGASVFRRRRQASVEGAPGSAL